MKKKKKVSSRKRKERSERIEALIRIAVFVVSGFILLIWRTFTYTITLINLIYTLMVGKRLRDVAELSEIWNTQWYIFQRYIIFVSNQRPFPFGKLEKNISKFNNAS